MNLYVELAEQALRRWEPVAREGGWCIRALTLWVEDGKLQDSVAVRDGYGRVYVVDAKSEELISEFPLTLAR